MTKEQIFKRLKDNKSLFIAEKKAALKFADEVNGYLGIIKDDKLVTVKSINEQDSIELDSINCKIVINTTNLLDSHGDVHIPGLWKKSLQEQKLIYHLQEHQMKFDKVISDEVKASAIKMNWSEIGEPFDGQTEALVFDSVVKEDRNEFMFEQYLKGYVKNHSVGMRYVNLFLCINSEEKYYREEKDNWDNYFPMVANSSDAEDMGYFWAVT